VAASVTLAGPSHRVTEPHHRDRYREIVFEAARDMAADLGWVEQDAPEHTDVPEVPRERVNR
jgi:hypothetical protein